MFLHCLFFVLELNVVFLVMDVPPSPLWVVAEVAGGSRFCVFFFVFLNAFCCLFLHCMFDVLELSVLFLVMHAPPSSPWGVAEVAGGSRFLLFFCFSR